MYFLFNTSNVGKQYKVEITKHIMEEVGNDVKDYKIGEIQFDDTIL